MGMQEVEQWYWETFAEENAQGGVFARYYDHLHRVLLHGVGEMRNRMATAGPELSEELLEAYLKQMQRITLRTLLLEMEVCKEEGTLEGTTEREKYVCFEKYFLGNPDYLREVYDAYPLMYEAILKTLGDFIRNIEEMLGHFSEDKREINNRFFPNCPCREILRIGGGNSDGHRHGHRVFILDLDNGEKLVYKPRSLAIDEKYGTLLQWIFQNLGMSLQWNGVWNRGDYGWCQWVFSAVCHSREELERYYYRNGILLCVSYLLGSEDIHYENLIACGEHPIIVDLEMIVGSRGMQQGTGTGATERFYQESVLQTGLLPLYTWNGDGEGVNVSAVNGKGGQLVPIAMPVVVNPGTAEMHIEYRRPAMGDGKNLATLEGRFIEPYEFLEEIQKGFGDAYSFFVGRKDEVQKRLDEFRKVRSRYVTRATQEYLMLLQTLGHPDMLVGEEERNLIWDILQVGTEPGEAGQWIREQEKRELICGDIPSFFYCPGECRIYSGTGESFEGYFAYPVLECLKRRLDRMGPEDLGRQQNLIHMALLMGTKQEMKQNSLVTNKGWSEEACAGHGIRRQEELECSRLKAAERIGNILLENAIWSEDGKEVGWLSMMMAGYRERSYLVKPMNCYLYGGLAGVALFMTEMSEKVEKQEFRGLRKILTDMLFRHTDELFQGERKGKLSTGAYTGESSLAFAYMLLYEACGDSVFLDYLRKQCQVTAGGLAEDQEYDVLGGNAGAILVFLKAYELTGENCYRAWAREAGDYLMRAAVDYGYGYGWVNRSAGAALTGFAHGTAGIMLALARLGHDVQEGKYMKAAYRAYQYEEHYYREDLLDWEDLRNVEQRLQESPKMAWCHGWGGIAMARLNALKYVEENFRVELEKIRGFIEQKLKDADAGKKISLKNSLCLCHGTLGNLALLVHMKKEGEEIRQLQYFIMEKIGNEEENMNKWVGLQECGDYGLVGGITGIGYSCLCGMGKVLELLYIS